MANSVKRIVIVGASLAGLNAAQALRDEGFAGNLTIIGDERHGPYDRPALSKRVLAGRMDATDTGLPLVREVDVEWILGNAATALDTQTHTVTLADGREVGYDRLLIATGTRATPWHDEKEAALEGVCTIRTLEDAAKVRALLDAGPSRVVVVGAGFIGSEVASVCRERGLEVTLVEMGEAPLVNALGGTAGSVATRLQRRAGVDFRPHTGLMSLQGDGQGRVRRVSLSDGDHVDTDLVILALGSRRNVEWLEGSGLAVDRRGVTCDASCRVFDEHGMVTDDVFAAGDVARWPHPLYDGAFIAVEHWSNAVEQACTAAHNMVCEPSQRRPHAELPTFWSNQFGVNIKSVGLPTVADQVIVTQGSVEDLKFVAVYGRQGRIVAAVAVDEPRWLTGYERLIRERAPFPPELNAADAPEDAEVLPTRFPSQSSSTRDTAETDSDSGVTRRDGADERETGVPHHARPL